MFAEVHFLSFSGAPGTIALVMAPTLIFFAFLLAWLHLCPSSVRRLFSLPPFSPHVTHIRGFEITTVCSLSLSLPMGKKAAAFTSHCDETERAVSKRKKSFYPGAARATVTIVSSTEREREREREES